MSKQLTYEIILSRMSKKPQNSVQSNSQSLKTLQNLQIKTLNLFGLSLEDISILSDLQSLEILSLSMNKIQDLSVFRHLKNIRELYLKDNCISEIEQIENLSGNIGLEVLNLKNNPIVNIPDYRNKILEILPNLKKLDEINITEEKDFKQIPNGHNNLSNLNLIAKKIQNLDVLNNNNKTQPNNNKLNDNNQETNNNNNLLLHSFKKKRTQGNFRHIFNKQKLDFGNKKQVDCQTVNENIENLLCQSANFNTLSTKKPVTSVSYIKKIIGNFRQDTNKKEDNLNGNQILSSPHNNTNTLDVEIYDKDNIISDLKNIQKEKENMKKRNKIIQGMKTMLLGLNKDELMEIRNEINKLLK